MNYKKFYLLNDRLIYLLERRLFLETEIYFNLNLKNLEIKKRNCFNLKMETVDPKVFEIETQIKSEQEKLDSYTSELQFFQPLINTVIFELQYLFNPCDQVALEIFGSHDN